MSRHETADRPWLSVAMKPEAFIVIATCRCPRSCVAAVTLVLAEQANDPECHRECRSTGYPVCGQNKRGEYKTFANDCPMTHFNWMTVRI